MEAIVLVILHQGVESISIHENHSDAYAALVEFVFSRWLEHFGENASPTPLEEEHIRRFFAADDDLYIIAETELSDLEAQIESLCRGKCPNF